MHLLLSLLISGLWIGAFLLFAGVLHSPRDLVLRYFALVILFLALQQTLVIDEYATSPGVRLVVNFLSLAAAFGKVCFFRTAMHLSGAPRPRLRRELGVVLLVALVDTVAFLLAPPGIRAEIGQPRYGYLTQAFVFEMITTAYLASVSCRIVHWTWRLVRRGGELRRVDNRLYRISLMLVGLASAVSLSSGVLDTIVHVYGFVDPSRMVYMQSYYVWIYFPVAIGFGVFLVGAMLPVLAEAFWAIPTAALQLAQYRVMGPLWEAMRDSFPQMSLRRQWGIRRRYYRRGLEIRDGLVLLKDYYDNDVAVAADQASRGRGDDDAARSVAVAVALVREALHAHSEGRFPDRLHPVPTSGAQDWATDTAWIVWLARAFAGKAPATPPPPLFSLTQSR